MTRSDIEQVTRSVVGKAFERYERTLETDIGQLGVQGARRGK